MIEEAAHFYERFHNYLKTHFNPLINNLYSQTIPDKSRYRLKNNWFRDLLQN